MLLKVEQKMKEKQTQSGMTYWPVKSGGVFYNFSGLEPMVSATYDGEEKQSVHNGKTYRWFNAFGRVLPPVPPQPQANGQAQLTPVVRESSPQPSTVPSGPWTIDPQPSASGKPTLTQIIEASKRILDGLSTYDWSQEVQGCRAKAAIVSTIIIAIGQGNVEIDPLPELPEPPAEEDDIRF